MADVKTARARRDAPPAVRHAEPGSVRVVLACVVAVVFGALTAGAQQWLPDQLRSLANSSGSWTLIAFLLALSARRAGAAALFGFASLAGLLAGYVAFAGIRGYASSTTMIVFWGAAAVVVGPLVGLGAHWAKTRRDALAAVGIGGMAGLLVGEGVYGLWYIAATTYPPYWWGSIIAGLMLLAGGVALRLKRVPTAMVAAGVCAATAAVFIAVYGIDLISLL